MNETLKKVIIELKTLMDLWANLQKPWENLPPPVKHNGTQHPKTVTVDDKNISKTETKRQNDKQEPIIQTVEAVKKIVVDETAKKDKKHVHDEKK